MKILFLILASDGGIYTELQKVWRSYIHSYPETIEAYFYKASPGLPTDYTIDGDVVKVKCHENLGNVAKKLKMVLTAFESRFDEFDYICRPNLSSFFKIPQYLEALKTLPIEAACMGKINTSYNRYPSGAGFTITPDIARAVIKDPFPQRAPGGDDVALGDVLRKLGVKIHEVPRIDFAHLIHREAGLKRFHDSPDIFHIRVKHEKDRVKLDFEIHSFLLRKVYGITGVFPQYESALANI